MRRHMGQCGKYLFLIVRQNRILNGGCSKKEGKNPLLLIHGKEPNRKTNVIRLLIDP